MEQVLIVDNHPLIREYLSGLLAKNGYEALTAEDGLSALGALRQSRPRVIFVDLIMPNIDGITLCRILRRLPNHRDAYIVILSALAAEAPQLTEACGANAIIAKGQFKTMGQSILKILEEARNQGYVGNRADILGIEELHVREISRELLSQKLHYELMLESLGEGILETTREERVVFGNPSAFSILGLREEQALGMPLSDLFPESDRAGIGRRLHEPNAQQELRVGERLVSVRMYPFPEPDAGTIVLLTDVTERKRMETMFLQAQRMESVGTLAAGVAHDFNNILMAVQGNVSMIALDVPKTHPHHARLAQIEEQVASAMRLTEQLLEYARGGRYEARPLDLARLVRGVAETYGRTHKNVTIQSDFPAQPCVVEGNPTQIEQLALNLLLNAGDALPGGGVIRIETRALGHPEILSRYSSCKPGPYALLCVQDPGVGMDAQTLNRIFEPFFTTKAMGKGLGLAAAYGIVKAHGGYIEAESQPGKGSTFRVYLPRLEGRDAGAYLVDAAAADAAAKVRGGPAKSGQGSILLVEDEGIIRLATRDMLGALGYHVIMAADGEEALSLFRENSDRVSLVILDVIMPGLGGAEVFRRIRETDPRARVLLCTGYSTDGDVRALLGSGAVGVIQKPFTLEKLADTLDGLLGRRE